MTAYALGLFLFIVRWEKYRMAQQPSEDKKMDFSSLPRAAISLKGLPVSRNTRLPSIRSPRDLTLGAPPKRTFMPNIPPRREKKPVASDSTKIENVTFEKKPMASPSERGRGRGRGKANIIQTEGSVFAQGIAESLLPRKAKANDSYQRSDYASSSKGTFIKKENIEKDVAGVSRKMNDLLRDDFIDDCDDEDEELLSKPIIFPPTEQVKKEVDNETAESAVFDPNIAKEMGFDINRIAKFIKKEKEAEIEEKKKVVNTEAPQNELTNFLNEEKPKLVLLQFPQCATLSQKMDIDSPESQPKGESSTDAKASDEQNSSFTSIGSLPEGNIGKLQVFKSGKARLLIGSLHFDLDSFNALTTKNELVSIRTNSNANDLTVLGYMEHKLKFAPNVDSLLS